tara:strand:+ start:25935 stop:26564 length:630 start_codon:yes stop_codon:yes gene_type:complete
MINLLVLDPHPIVRSSFKDFLSDYNFLNVSGCVETAKEGLSFIDSNPIDVLISEMILIDESPINLINQIKEIKPQIKVIFFTSQDENVYSFPLLKAGAIGFLSKNIKASVLAEAIKKVQSYELYITNNFNNQLDLDIDLEKPRNSFGSLSAREIEVLKYLTDGKRNIEIAERLKINQKTVNTYKNRMMQKLNVDNMLDLYLQAKNLSLV